MRYVFALLAFITFAREVYGHDPEYGSASSYHDWFLAQRQEHVAYLPRCCGELEQNGGDARYVDVKRIGTHYYVRLDGTFVRYPLPVNPSLENPTGRNVLWYKRIEGLNIPEYLFYCLRLALGA